MKTTYLNENSQVEKSSNCARGGTSAASWPKLLVDVSSLTVNACTSSKEFCACNSAGGPVVPPPPLSLSVYVCVCVCVCARARACVYVCACE